MYIPRDVLHSSQPQPPLVLRNSVLSPLFSLSLRGQVRAQRARLKRRERVVTLLTCSLLRSTVSVFPPGFAAFQNCFWAE